MSALTIPFGILQRISEFLAALPENQIEDLAEGRAHLAYVPAGATEPVPVTRSVKSRHAATLQARSFTPSAETSRLLQRFETTESRPEAAALLAGLKKPALVDIAKALNVPGAASMNVAPLRLEIVEATVGRRLDSIATRGFTGDRP